jgi:hypothetical protein
MLRKKGFSTQVIPRGAAAEKRQQKLLDKAFAVPPEDEAQLLADQFSKKERLNDCKGPAWQQHKEYLHD